MTENQSSARVGTSAWKKAPWRGNFYPRGLVQDRELKYASDRLATLEINTTFHGHASPSSFLKWRAETPEDFVFSVKGPRIITHDHALRNPSKDLADFFCSGVLGLGEKLAVVLWQIPPSLSFHPKVVEAFLAVLPRSVYEAQRLIEEHGLEADLPDAQDRPIRYAFEVRHPSFLDPAFTELLSRHEVAAVVTNSPGWPHFREVTADVLYLRLHGDQGHYPDGYDEATLDEWAELVDGWRSGRNSPDGRGREVFVYFDNPDHSGIRSPFDAMDLQRRLDGPEASRRHPPTFQQPSLW